MHVIFESMGTRGDVAPVIAVAKELLARGHSCELLTNDVFAEEASRAGILVRSVSKRLEILRRAARFEDYLYCSYAPIVQELTKSGRRGSALLVNCDRYCASNLVAERHGLTVVRLHLSPFKLRPYARHLVPPYDLFARNERVLDYVNGLRARLGLRSVDTACHEEPYVARHVAVFPRWFCHESLVDSLPLEFVGFPLPAESGPLPEALEAFVAQHGTPLLFTYGTGDDDIAGFIREAEHCCRELDLPGVVLCPRGVGNHRGSERLLLSSFVPLGAILPRSLLLVHHGGIGTAARAIEAAVPQVIMPVRFDQTDNGFLIARLGIGSMLDGSRESSPSLASVVAALLESDDVRRRGLELQRRVAGSNTITRWADVLTRELDAVA